MKPARKLQSHEADAKAAAKQILTRINRGEEVYFSVVHYSELCNIIEYYLPLQEALTLERGLLLRRNIHVCDVTQDDFLGAVSVAEEHSVGLNDALAYVLMKQAETTKIYSFDKHFDSFQDIQRINE